MVTEPLYVVKKSLQRLIDYVVLCVGCVPGFHFVPNSFCVRCPSDTYQDKQGQTTCENCPVNTGTINKTGMISKSNCSAGTTFKLCYDRVYMSPGVSELFSFFCSD